jgi:hypothetical protein
VTVPVDGPARVFSLLNKYTLHNYIYNSKLLAVLQADIWIFCIKLYAVCLKSRKPKQTGRVASSHPRIFCIQIQRTVYDRIFNFSKDVSLCKNYTRHKQAGAKQLLPKYITFTLNV